MTAGPRGPALLQNIWLIEKLAHFDREVIPGRRMHSVACTPRAGAPTAPSR
jgi:catalase